MNQEIKDAVAKISKSIAGGLSAILVVFLARWHVSVDSDTQNALQALLVALVGGGVSFLVVYFSPKNKE